MVRVAGAEVSIGAGALRGRERQILLQALRYRAEPEKDGGLPAVDERRWEHIFQAAAQLGVAPLLYARLKAPPLRAAVPSAVLQRHKGDFLWSQAQNMKVFARLRDVLTVLRASRIEVMALKGAALAELVYGQIGLRTMGDIDLLVRRSDLAKVQVTLEDLGFQPDESYRVKEWYETQHHHMVPYVSHDGLLKVDVHHDITTVSSPIRVPVDNLWARAQTVRIASMPCLTLSWEHMLLHLALHLADQNRFLGSLRGLCDVAEIVRRFPSAIDWGELVGLAQAWGAATPVLFTLSLSREALGAAVPSRVLHELRRDMSLLPFEEGALRSLCLRAALIIDADRHVVYDWIFLDLLGGRLKDQSRLEVMRDITSSAARRLRGRWA